MMQSALGEKHPDWGEGYSVHRGKDSIHATIKCLLVSDTLNVMILPQE